MPNKDMTGPRGIGQMTDRGFRYGRMNYGSGIGGGFHGRGFGLGRDMDSFSEDVIPNALRKQILENQINLLKDQISLREEELLNLNNNEKKANGWD